MKKARYLAVIYASILLIIILIAPGAYAENRDKKDENRKQGQNQKEQKASPPPQRVQSAPAQQHERPHVQQQERPRVQQERKVETHKPAQKDNVPQRSATEQRKAEQGHKQQPSVSSAPPKRVPPATAQKHEKLLDQHKKYAPNVKEKHDAGHSDANLHEKPGTHPKGKSSHPDVKREDRKVASVRDEKKDNRDFKHDRHTRRLNDIERREIHQKMNHRPSDRERMESRKFVREERTRFRHAYSSRFVPSHYHRTVLKRMRIAPASYHYRRHVYYDYYGYVPPAYVYGWYPYYGIWDAVFLGLVLERAFDPHFSAFYYHHMYDDDIIRWRQEVERQAMENAQLRARLDQLDQEVAGMRGTPRDDSYIPPDAGDLAISPDIIDQLN